MRQEDMPRRIHQSEVPDTKPTLENYGVDVWHVRDRVICQLRNHPSEVAGAYVYSEGDVHGVIIETTYFVEKMASRSSDN